jgi:hypothetical protein
VDINKPTKEEFYNALLETFFYSKIFDIKIHLHITSGFVNTELMAITLAKEDDWVYHYFIPFTQTSKNTNILLVAWLKTPSPAQKKSIKNVLNIEYSLEEPYKILQHLISSINFENLDVMHHSCLFSSQLF